MADAADNGIWIRCDCGDVHRSTVAVCPGCGRCSSCGRKRGAVSFWGEADGEVTACTACGAPCCAKCGRCHVCGRTRFSEITTACECGFPTDPARLAEVERLWALNRPRKTFWETVRGWFGSKKDESTSG